MNNNQTTNNSISFVIKKSPIKIFNFCATGAVAIIIAFSGFVHDLWPLFIGMFGLMTLFGAAEAMYGETEISNNGVHYKWLFFKKSISLPTKLTIDGVNATINGSGAREVIMLTKLSNKDIQRLQEMYEKYWSKNSQT